VVPNSYDYEENRVRLGSSLGVASWNSPVWSTTTYAQLAARDTFNDYQLVRGS
jgi:hypothetical protein